MTQANIPDNRTDFFQAQYKKYIRMGFSICILFFLGILLAATLIRISGAITAKGTVVQIGENKSIEHDKGGPIREILVEDGDIVNKGDTLLVLDSVSVDSQLALLQQQQFELNVKLDRLEAMDQNREEFFIDPEKYGDATTKYPKVVETQESVFNAQRNLMLTSLEELEVRLSGLDDEIKAINKQRRTSQQQLAILDESYGELSKLFEKQLISKSRLTQTERDRVNVLTQLESLKVTALQKENTLNETQQRIEKLIKERKEKIWQDIEKTKEELAKTDTSILSTQDEFSRLSVKAPVSGRVHELAVNNTNEVIRAGDTILQIVPNSGNYIIHAKVKPADIEQLYFGQETRIRFDSFDRHKTPEIVGRVLFIAADSSEETGSKSEKYFLVKVSLEPTETEKVTSAAINSGLPVSTMFTTNERSLMSYLVKPIADQLFSAFREE